MWTQALGRGWDPVGVEFVGRSMDGRATPAMATGGGRPCSLVWWVCGEMGGRWVVNWRV